MVYGPSNQGKTLLALLMSYCVAIGRPFGEMRTYPEGLVIYVVLEGGGSEFTDRLRALRKQYPEDSQELLDRFIVLETTLDLRSKEKSGDAKQLLGTDAGAERRASLADHNDHLRYADPGNRRRG